MLQATWGIGAAILSVFGSRWNFRRVLWPWRDDRILSSVGVLVDYIEE